MGDREVNCSGCGEKVALSSEDPPCRVLDGWLMLSQWKGIGSVEQYHFCSLTCLEQWVKAQAPEVPRIFLESFPDEEGEGNSPL